MKPIETHEDLLGFYRQQTHHSSPGPMARLFEDLPETTSALADVLHGLIIHMWWISKETYGLTHADLKAAGRDILDEISLATVEEMLSKILELDPRPLAQPREPSSRLVGNCRDYSLLLVSIFRHRGIPARARTGSATYFFPNELRYEDHWICEVWNADRSRWQQVDAQIDDVMKRTMKMGDPTDLPSDAFLTGWQCYEGLASGRIKPAELGYGPDFNGMSYVRQKLLADLSSVTGQEILPWGGWGVAGGDVQEGDEQLLAEIADLLRHIDDPEVLQQARNLIATRPRVKRPDNYSAGRFQEAWL